MSETNDGQAETRQAPRASRHDFIVLARIGRPRGNRGELHLHLQTDRPEEVLARPGRYRLADGRTIEVAELIGRGSGWCWVVAGRPDREALKAYTNATVVAAADELPPRSEGEFAESEIVGLVVRDTLGRIRGRVARIERRYEVDTWVVRDERGREGDLAAIAEFVLGVDRERGEVTVAPEAILW